MLVWLVDHFQPDKADDNPKAAHKEEHMRPTHFVRQPAHDWGKNNGGKVLRRVKDCDRRSPLLCREPGRDDATVAGEGRRFRQTDEEAQGKQRDDNAESAEDIDEAL